MATFTWTPDNGAATSFNTRLKVAQFGDGYAQRATDGLNATMISRKMTFSGRKAAEATAILDFIKDHGYGVTAFDYTHLNDISRKYLCGTPEVVNTAYGVTISAVFVQVPA